MTELDDAAAAGGRGAAGDAAGGRGVGAGDPLDGGGGENGYERVAVAFSDDEILEPGAFRVGVDCMWLK